MINESVKQLHAIRQAKSSLEKQEKGLLADIKAEIDPLLDASGITDYQAGELIVSRIAGTNVSIKSELLMERGVAPDIIDYATKRSGYFQYRIKEAPAAEVA